MSELCAETASSAFVCAPDVVSRFAVSVIPWTSVVSELCAESAAAAVASADVIASASAASA